MGSPLSPILVNIYMEYFKEMALGSTSLKPFMWLRYADDTFIFWPHQKDVQTLLDHVNSIGPSKRFTIEKEQDDKLSFLHVLRTHREQGFRSFVYHKPTFTRHYLNFNSYQPFYVKRGIFRCLQHQAKDISSNIDAYQEEMISLRYKFHSNSAKKPG